MAPADRDAGDGRVLDDVSGHRGISLDANPDAIAVVRIGASGALGHEIADQVALHHREAAALVEVSHRHPDGRAVDSVVGNHRTLESELRIDRDLAERGAGVIGDLDIGGRVAAHRGESSITNAVAAHGHIVRAEDADGIPVLP